MTGDTPDYSVIALVIVAVAVVVKIVLGWYVRHTGEKVNSDSLINSGKDATLDSVISAAPMIWSCIITARIPTTALFISRSRTHCLLMTWTNLSERSPSMCIRSMM